MSPHNSYALSKRDQDDFGRLIGERYGIPTTCFRYSIVQGPRQSFRNAYSGALRAFTVCALDGEPPVLFEDGLQLRDYVSIRDVVRANLLPLEHSEMHGHAFNVGGDRQVSVRELADAVVSAVGRHVEPVIGGLFRVGDTRHVFSDVSSLDPMGWRPAVDQTSMVEEYVAWASDQPGISNTYAEAERKMQALGVLLKAEVPS